MDLSALAEPWPCCVGSHRGERCMARCGLGSPSDHLRRSFIPAFPLGTPPSDQLVAERMDTSSPIGRITRRGEAASNASGSAEDVIITEVAGLI